MLQLAFFSFVDVVDDSRHAEYNEWHLYDHRPENLALKGVAWGDRWARLTTGRGTDLDHTDPDIAGIAVPEYAGVDYVAMYWFREPLDRSVAEWQKLGADSVQWGRGPAIPGVVRRLTAFFIPVRGYAAPRVLVSPDVLPYRPNRGLHVTLSRFAEPLARETHLRFRWYDRVRIPELLEVPGVAGAWSFALADTMSAAPGSITDSPAHRPGELRIRVLWLDDDPAAVTHEIRLREKAWAGEGRGDEHAETEQVLFSAPLRTIVPFQDW